MKKLVFIGLVLLALVCAAPAGAVTASITLDVHQDIQGIAPNDFHVVGQIKSYISAPTLAWHSDGPFTSFTYTITKTVPADPTDPWYDFTADWSMPGGIPYCTVIHLGLLFDVEGSNTTINLKGWWTLNGRPVGEIITGQVNKGFVPIIGFDVDDNMAGQGQKIRLTNGNQENPPLPAPPGPIPPPIPVQIVKMDVIVFHAGQAPKPDDLTETGPQATWNWVPVNNANGMPIGTQNPLYIAPDSFFDIFLSPKPGFPSASSPVVIENGGFLVARTLNQFTNNSGELESRWAWEVHQFSDSSDWKPGDEYKYVQMPDCTNTGIDIRCDRADGKFRYLADDFKCIEYGPITDIHFWGSWKNDIKGQIQNIHVAFFDDVPATPLEPSHPGNLKWERDFPAGSFSEKLYNTLPTGQYEWWWDNYLNTLLPNGDRQVWQYNIDITDANRFIQYGSPQNPIIYWIAIYVDLMPTSQAQFGWKTRDWRNQDFGGGHFNDDACYKNNNTWALHDYHYPQGHPRYPDSLDMSFVLTGQARDRDWGDAPDSMTLAGYPTLSTNNGANHGIIPGFCLGNLIDSEPNGQPNANATGDDTNNLADEDGVTFAGSLIRGQMNTITVQASVGGQLDAWIDWGHDNSWNAGDQICANLTLAAGPNPVTFFVPASANLGQTFARFRLSSVGNLPPTGWANDGEVEDYQVTIADPAPSLDFGDLPDAVGAVGYPTLLANDGARHIIVPGVYLGSKIDAEADAWQSLGADGDDTHGSDDEDGVSWTALKQGQPATFTVQTSCAGFLSCFFDFDGNGTFSAAESFNFGLGGAGFFPAPINIPADAVSSVYARFRFCTTDVLPAGGLAKDGEVEDYLLSVEQAPKYDYGDAPAPYPTLSVNNGPSHTYTPNLMLGTVCDIEIDGQPTANADGDDNNPAAADDEDGVTFSALRPGNPATATVFVTGANGKLDAWIDLNADGDWDDTGEQIAISQPMVPGNNTVGFMVPADAPRTKTYARFRLSYTGGLGYKGFGSIGEVEDYQVEIGPKWQQLPDTSYFGIDVNASNQFILADDFLCRVTGPITKLVVWGSWKNDLLPFNDPSKVSFTLSLHRDIPAGVQGNFSMPGAVLWYKQFNPSQFTVEQVIIPGLTEGWMDPPNGYIFPGDHNLFKYTFTLQPGEFIQEGTLQSPVVYWLDVKAQPQSTGCQFGWKTAVDHWNDDATWGLGNEPFTGPWNELRYPSGHEYYGRSIDLAFEIEGHAIDCGDAPDSYPTKCASNGPVHMIVPGFHLGNNIDAEPDGIPSLGANGDDLNAIINDEDGVVFAGPIARGVQTSVKVFASAVGKLDTWIDFNCDGDFADAGEYVFAGQALNAGNNVLTFVSPASTIPGRSYARFRFSSAGVASYMGFAPDGEVEDYAVTISPTPVVVNKAQAKQKPIGTYVLIKDDIVTANFGCTAWYFEEPTRFAGIGVLPPVTAPAPLWAIGDKVSCYGQTTLNGFELMINELASWKTGTGVITPMGQNNRDSGGGTYYNQPGVYDDPVAGLLSARLNSIALLVRLFGKCTYIETDPTTGAQVNFWIWDGSKVWDGTSDLAGAQVMGVKVRIPSALAAPIVKDAFYTVTGIMRTDGAVSPVRWLWPRDTNDVIKYVP